jgi:hypothetical protein
LGLSGPTILSLSLDRPPSARIPAFWAEAPEPLLNPNARFCNIVED